MRIIKNKEIDVNKQNRDKIFKTIMEQLLDNNSCIASYLGKRIKDITIDYGVLFIMLEENMTKFKLKVPTIPSPYGKINYIFKVLEEQISR